MKTIIKVINKGLIFVFLCGFMVCIVLGTIDASAAGVGSNDENIATNSDGIAEPYALFADVVVAIDGGDGKVWGAAQTKAAIFATAIQVVVELYSSDTYQDSYTKMTLEKRVSTNNLKKGEIIKAEVPTNGVEKYWRARMYYKADAANWKYGETNTWLFDANGIIVL